MFRTTRANPDELRALERRVAVQQRRIDHLERMERRLVITPSIEYEWECTHCRFGWIVRDGDQLRCTSCGYLRYL